MSFVNTVLILFPVLTFCLWNIILPADSQSLELPITLPPYFDENYNPGDTRNWTQDEKVDEYEIKSDGLKVQTKILKSDDHTLRMRIGKLGSARFVQKKFIKRILELKISNWNQENWVNIKVPYGQSAERLLKVVESVNYVDVMAPVPYWWNG